MRARKLTAASQPPTCQSALFISSTQPYLRLSWPESLCRRACTQHCRETPAPPSPIAHCATARPPARQAPSAESERVPLCTQRYEARLAMVTNAIRFPARAASCEACACAAIRQPSACCARLHAAIAWAGCVSLRTGMRAWGCHMAVQCGVDQGGAAAACVTPHIAWSGAQTNSGLGNQQQPGNSAGRWRQ